VFHAVFDRSIPKLLEILLMEGIEDFKYRDALITLNEMASHQENKEMIIALDGIEISSFYLIHKNEQIRR